MKHFLITGVTSGLGLALTEELCRGGHKVYGAARRREKLEELEKQFGENFRGFQTDVTKKEEVEDLLKTLAEKLPPPDCVILNAGVNTGEKKELFDCEAMEEIFKTNVFAAFYFIEPLVQKRYFEKIPQIVTISSTASLCPKSAYVSYAASKQALNFLVEGLRIRMGFPKGILTNIILGPVDTPLLQNSGYNDPMFKLTAPQAARKILKVVERGKAVGYVPWSVATAVRLLSLLPNGIYRRITALAQRNKEAKGVSHVSNH